jgi:7-cyano-7-deazaguanine synthase
LDEKSNNKAIILLSGGIDSAVALYWAIEQHYEITALSINFYMRSPQEQAAVHEFVQRAKVKLLEVDIPFLKEASNLEEEHVVLPYTNQYPEGYVPTRNLIFYAIAAYYAEVLGIATIIGGHLQSDPEKFPDSAPQFFQSLGQIINTTKLPIDGGHVKFLMPLANRSKTDVIRLGKKLHVPLEFAWSCYWEDPIPCGVCNACKERSFAFKEMNMDDPLLIRLRTKL